ncbi:MAG: hypothetical protein QXZ25_04105 [Candidatus Bathyarchaeia archaeon]
MAEGGRSPRGADWLGLVSSGFFLVLVGTIWMANPNFTDKMINFFKDFRLTNVTEHVAFPAPAHNHPAVYAPAMQFCFVFGIFQVVILALRFVFHEPLSRKAETASGVAFWFAAGSFLYMLLNEAIGWFGFISGVIISVGLAMTISSIVRLLG